MVTIPLDQIIILLLLILLPLVNFIVRWLGRSRAPQWPEDAETEELPVQPRRRRQPAPGKTPKPRDSVRTAAPEPTRPGPPPRRSRSQGFISPAEARSAIVLMTILGPCRALEPPQQ